MPASFLRYRFDGSDEARRHFHVIDGRAFFFYPQADLLLLPGSRVALEVGFTQSDQVCTIHGVVVQTTAEPRGLWLEFPAARVGSGLEEALREPKRHHRRIPTNLLVSVSRTPTVSHLARLLDLSTGSARLGETSLTTGENLWLRVLGAVPQMPGELGPARVTWVHGTEAGVRFLNSSVGRAIVMNVVLRMDELWASAKSVRHADICPCAMSLCVNEPQLSLAWPGQPMPA